MLSRVTAATSQEIGQQDFEAFLSLFTQKRNMTIHTTTNPDIYSGGNSESREDEENYRGEMPVKCSENVVLIPF